jgi:SAP domain-containing ribonucleoprotein
LEEVSEQPATTNGSESTTTAQPTLETNDTTPATTLTPEQQAMKARAERFGVPFNPNPTPTSKKTPTPKTDTSASSAVKPKEKEKVAQGAIDKDKASLGISEEVLAKRAAKFGLPEKKEVKSGEAKGPEKAAEPVAAKKPEAEISPLVIHLLRLKAQG